MTRAESLTKGEIRRARKAARAAGEPLTGDLALACDPRPCYVRVRTDSEETRHSLHMERWARRYHSLNGAPEGDGDR